jgi:hypothetical protein
MKGVDQGTCSFGKAFYRSDGPAKWAKAKLVRDADDFVICAPARADG